MNLVTEAGGLMMPWVSKTYPKDECSALERIWPQYAADLNGRGKRELAVDEFMEWIHARPVLGVAAFKGDRGKKKAQAANPGREVINAQNGLYHLSGNSRNYEIHDTESGKQVIPLEHIEKLTYRLR